MNLPGYSRFNGDEAIWGCEEATGNLCLGTRAAVQGMVGNFLAGLASRKEEVTAIQGRRSPPQHTA